MEEASLTVASMALLPAGVESTCASGAALTPIQSMPRHGTYTRGGLM